MSHIPILDPERKSTLIRYTRSNTTEIDTIRELMYDFLAGKLCNGRVASADFLASARGILFAQYFWLTKFTTKNHRI